MDALVTVGFGGGNVIFYPARQRLKVFMNYAQGRVTIGRGFGNNPQRDNVVNFAEVFRIFFQFFVQGLQAFYPAVNFQILYALGPQNVSQIFFHNLYVLLAVF